MIRAPDIDDVRLNCMELNIDLQGWLRDANGDHIVLMALPPSESRRASWPRNKDEAQYSPASAQSLVLA